MTLTMNNRGPRIALVVLVTLAFAAAAWWLWTAERRLAGIRAAERTLQSEARGLAVNLADLRAAQQAYVAAGQAEQFWTGRAASLFHDAEAGLASLRQLAASPEAGQALGAAADQLAAFGEFDARVREQVAIEQKLLASDLIFGDSAQATTACSAQVEEAVARELGARERELVRVRFSELIALLCAVAVALAGLLVLLPRRAAAAGDVIGATVPQEPAPLPLEPLTQAAPAPDLEALARLCGEFSRVGEPAGLQPLIERSAAVLGASGVIVWMANPATSALQPVLSHGYSAQALARIGDLTRDADNAAAEAFRTGELQVVEGSGRTNGAIVTPLVTPAGCVGVVAAEVRSGAEKEKANQAVAAILAAQLASLVSSSPDTP